MKEAIISLELNKNKLSILKNKKTISEEFSSIKSDELF